MSLYHILKNAFNVGIEHLHGQFATLGSLEYGLILLVLTRLQHIVASKHRSYGIVASIPVAHKHTLPAPLVANDSSKQFTILHSVWTIQLIRVEFYSKFPSTASIVLGKLGLKNAFAFDFWGACCGFLYTLDVAATMIQSGRYKKIIVIGADKMSSVVDYKDRQTCPLFGDGAAAVLLEATEEQNIGVMDSYFRTDGKGLPFLHLKAGGSVCPPSHFTVDHRLHYLYQEGRTVFRYAVTNMSNDCAIIAERNGLNKDNIQWVVPHQANMRIIEAVAKRLELPMEQVMVNIERYGNTSAATIPLAIWEYENKLKKGDNLILTAFGAGFVHGASYYKWAYDGSK